MPVETPTVSRSGFFRIEPVVTVIPRSDVSR
jgi:hypothetical protein